MARRYILLPIFRKQFNWIEYSQHGEFALYSAAFLAPTLRLIGKDVDDSVFVRRQTFLFLGWVFLTAAVALYSGVISAAQMPPNTLAEKLPNAVDVNTHLLFGFSISLFVFSVVFSSLVRLIDYQRIQPKQVFELQQASETRLDGDFEKIIPQIKKSSSDEIPAAMNQQSTPNESERSEPALADPDEKLGSDSNANEGPDDGTTQN